MTNHKAPEPQPLISRSGKRGYIRNCQGCGKEMQGVAQNAKWCPECRDRIRREHDRQYRETHRNRVPSHYKDDLSKLTQVADWAGLSYGRFMAKSPEARADLIAAYDRNH